MANTATTTTMEATAKDILSVDEAARLCGVHRNTLFRATWRGELPSFRLGNRRLIRAASLARWMTEQEEREVAARRSA